MLGVDHPATKIYSVSIECAWCRPPKYKDIVSEQRMCLLLTIQLQSYTQLALNVLAVEHPATKIYSVSRECACCRPPSYKDILSEHWMCLLSTTQHQRYTQWAENVLGVDHPATKIYSVSRECACCRPSSYKDIVSEQRMCLLLTTQLQIYTQLALNVLAVEHTATKIYSVSRECACCRPPSYNDILS